MERKKKKQNNYIIGFNSALVSWVPLTISGGFIHISHTLKCVYLSADYEESTAVVINS